MLVKFIVCVVAGLGAGIGTGLAGLSAAAVISPMLITFLGFPAYQAVAISLASDVLASAASAYTYGKNRNLDIRNGLVMLAAVLVLLAVTAAVVAYTQIVVTEEGYYSIVLKETVNGRNCVYVEDRGHLIRLKCGEDVDFDALTLRDERGDTISYQMDFQWNRLTRTGTVSACEDTGVTVLGGVMDVTYEGDSGSVPLLFGDTSVQYLRDGYYPDPYAESENLVFLCDVRFWPYHPEEPDPTGINTRAILEVEDCINAEALDVDGDGALEVAVRTRWPEKPYTVYDYVDGEIVESWPDTLPEEILEQMWAPWEGL